jgi:hypothetical protein
MKLEKKVWVIMDKKRKVIGMGTPRNRELKFFDSIKGSNRILTYKSKRMAEAGFKSSGFYDHTGDYLEKEYDYGAQWEDENGERKWSGVIFEDFLEAVEATIIIEI